MSTKIKTKKLIKIAQVSIETAMDMERDGYMREKIVGGKSYPDGTRDWIIPGVPGVLRGVYAAAVTERAKVPEQSIEYAAAYLNSIQDKWKNEYSKIDGDTAILSTLYNIGAYGSRGPHGNPEPNDFGRYSRANYYYVRSLLGS